MKIAQKMRMMINMKHECLCELFPEGQLTFPYGEEDYHDFDARDTFNMSYTLVAWLYECLRYFQDEASKIVDFTFCKFTIDGDVLTHEQCIDRMVKDCKIILLYNDNMFDDFKKDDEYIENVVNPAKNDLFKILSKVYWNMWW